MARRSLRASLGVGGAVVVIGLQGAIGLLAVVNAQIAIAMSAVLVLGLLGMFDPLIVAALSFPATLATWRLGGSSLDMSYADAVLVMSVLVALPYVPWHSRLLHRMLGAAGVYLVVLAITLVANPSTRAVLELVHRMVLLCGSMLVGSAIAAAGRTRFALRLFLAAAVTLSVAAVLDSLSSGLEPAYPLGVHKNAAGMLLTCALLVLVIAPDLVRIPKMGTLPVQAVLAAGLLACQSRASAATFLAALFIAALRNRGSRAFVPVIGAIALAAMIWTTSQNLTEDSPDARFNSLNTRLEAYDSSMEIWAEQPIFGAGLRYFRDPDYAVSEPHNVIVVSLGESGLIGTLGLVVMLVMVVAGLRKGASSASRLAIYLVVAQVVNGLADIYWVAGRGTLPWLIVGIAVGTEWVQKREARPSGVGEAPALADHRHTAFDLR